MGQIWRQCNAYILYEILGIKFGTFFAHPIYTDETHFPGKFLTDGLGLIREPRSMEVLLRIPPCSFRVEFVIF
jgi:hypothetical protein